MFDDDDDADPHFTAVDKYHFENGMQEPVSLSVLPLKFDEIDEVACLDSTKVDLHGFADNGLHTVHAKVVAWRVGFDYEQPKITVLSSEGYWIELLKPRKCYEKTVRSVLISVQMLHFVKKWPRKENRSLLNHLCEVFNKFDIKPSERDLKKQHSIIKFFAERDPTLMKSKILQRIMENTPRKTKKGVGATERLVASSSDDEEDLDNDDDDYNDKDDNSDDDSSCNNDYNDGDDNSNDDSSFKDDDSDDDGDIDKDDDTGTDNLCAMCDNGGKLLSCEGRCKRAFHPREKDGRESNCDTLGFSSAQLQEIGHYLCKNCEFQQHQCFKCEDLEPSDGPNAKVFQCYKACCGHFYHPSCIAKLLEPHDNDGACELEKRIAAGMAFTCPAHWCSKCGKMEDHTEIPLWLAVCRRCPISYHKKCLPRNISFEDFEEKDGRKSIRAWHLDDRIIIYCRQHEIEDKIGTPRRDHIKLPSIKDSGTIGTHCMDHMKLSSTTESTRDLAKKKAQVTGKRKMNTDQGLTGTEKLSNKISQEKAGQIQGVVIKNDTVHLNRGHCDELDKLTVDEQAKGDENNAKSGKERKMHRGENAYGHDLTLEKGKTPGVKSNTSGLTIGGLTSGHIDDPTPEKKLQIAYVKTPTSNRINSSQDSGWDGEKQVYGSDACQQDPKSPHCNDNSKATEIDTSVDKSRARRGQEEQASDGNMLDLDTNRKKFHKKNGDVRDKVQSPQRIRDIENPRSKSLPQRTDDQRASKSSEYIGREGRGSSRGEWRDNRRASKHNSLSGRRSPQKRSRASSPQRRRMDYLRSNNQHRYEQGRRDDYSSDGDVGRRRLSPQQPAFSRDDFGTMPSPPSSRGRAEYGTSERRTRRAEEYERHGSPWYLRRPEGATSRMDDSSLYALGSDYAMDRTSVPVHHPRNVDLDYGDYHLMDIARVDRHSAYGARTDTGWGENAALSGGGFSDYGLGSDYPPRLRSDSAPRLRSDSPPRNGFKLGDLAFAAGSVTDKYVPQLDQTNHYTTRGHGGLSDVSFQRGHQNSYRYSLF
ncbi:uncharacterized protein LOC100832660 isoform X2 [Brachypodium distachyon]|uniref:Zinc finger PHD-type domain-containing protein n=1 Tax=Brachypodium distachyon TaxID=15368 RepID=A0A0Q3LVJ0_BRADI|nr:uncharacterized protein LOC100832660 isoform X2 [Brachypodium distachyon]KQJ96325.1 hypothetical protein BRADI_3g22461v3 [Brachypodium distachyon]KQJ96326.1 hypothetical protein BRADI_3g22461v3 [Brachypodium distachyon]|eukprot:XP_010234642.1 uncharacterized protein LOC100832660 isoform X2 [Brachypodium distachyon]